MRWDIISDEKLKNQIALGNNYREIAIKLNTSQRSVTNRAFRLNLKILKEHHETITCKNCSKIIVKTISDEKIFCDKSCSAQYNNRNRKHTLKTKTKISNSVKDYNANNPKLKIIKLKKIILKKEHVRKCKSCDSIIVKKYVRICDNCYNDYYKFYRPQCEFDFNIYDFKNEFDFNIIKEYGWYSPSNKENNLNGVSRDHIYSCKDGFINRIAHNIIKHPANCALMKHSENNIKNTKSNITLDELLEKIIKWNKKYII
jgi:hypothetical protein